MSELVRPIVTKREELVDDTGDSPGLTRYAGVSIRHTPARRLWFGMVTNSGGFRSLPHHHGEAETGGFVLRGHARIYFGLDYQEHVEMHAGDFVFVPPHLPHVEVNMSPEDELVWMTTRTPDNLVFDLDDVADSLLRGFRRNPTGGEDG